jgi:hypothetical protein
MKARGKVLASIVAAFFVLTILATAAFAVPKTINYQGRLSDSEGVPVNGTVSMTFAIYNAPTGGELLWSETQSSVTVTDGAFSVALGSVTLFTVTFDEEYYLGVKVGGDAEMTPRAALVSVPYALRAKEADSVGASSVTSSKIEDGAIVDADISPTANISASKINRTGLDADLLDGQDSTAFAASAHGHTGADITSGTVADARVATTIARDSEIMPIVLASDGAGSTLDADLLDGQQATAFAASAHGHSGADITDGTVTGAKLSVPLDLSGSSASPIVSGTNTGTGKAGYFEINNADSTETALYAENNGHGHAGHFVNNASILIAALKAEAHAKGDAVYGLTTGTARAGYFRINNTANPNAAIYADTNGSGNAVYAITSGSGDAIRGATTGSGYSGYFSGGAGVYVQGNLNVTGALSKGSGTFVQPHPTDPSKELVYAFFEGPEHAVFLRGTARLVDGKAIIETPEHFRAVAGEEGITVQFTPRSSDTFGLAAVDITRDRIVVAELKGETHTYEFDYFITAKRAGFEAHEPIQPNTHFTADMRTAEEFEKTYAKDDMTISAMRKLLVSNGILTANGKLNMELARELGWVVKDSDVAMKEAE